MALTIEPVNVFVQMACPSFEDNHAVVNHPQPWWNMLKHAELNHDWKDYRSQKVAINMMTYHVLNVPKFRLGSQFC